MSELIECDCCKKQAYYDANMLYHFCEVRVSYLGKVTRFHLCEDCYKDKLLKDVLNIDSGDA